MCIRKVVRTEEHISRVIQSWELWHVVINRQWLQKNLMKCVVCYMILHRLLNVVKTKILLLLIMVFFIMIRKCWNHLHQIWYFYLNALLIIIMLLRILWFIMMKTVQTGISRAGWLICLIMIQKYRNAVGRQSELVLDHYKDGINVHFSMEKPEMVVKVRFVLWFVICWVAVLFHCLYRIWTSVLDWNLYYTQQRLLRTKTRSTSIWMMWVILKRWLLMMYYQSKQNSRCL